MTDSTKNIILAAISADSSISTLQRDSVLHYLTGGIEPQAENRVIKRHEAARLLGVSTKTLDWMARQKDTLLRRVYTNPSRSRACGFTHNSVMATINTYKS